jgi:competence protein ComGC
MKRKQNAFSLAEFLIVVAFLAVIGFGIFTLFGGGGQGIYTQLFPRQAQAYAAQQQAKAMEDLAQQLAIQNQRTASQTNASTH